MNIRSRKSSLNLARAVGDYDLVLSMIGEA